MSNYNTLKTADTINAISIVDGAITTSKLNASVTTLITSGSGPKVAAITYPGNDLAADTAGGQTITLTGTGFVSGCSVFVGTTQASVVTFISATSVTFTSPALAAATYTLYLVNPDGGTATIVPGVSYSGTPIWSTTAGTLGSIYEYSPISNATTATGDGSISYSVFSGTLPTGSSLNTSTGVITGTSPASAGATTYTFVIRATDAQLQDSDRTFSITVNTDVVTWTTPAANSTVTLGQGLASTSTLLATSAAGNAITYTANALPTGLSISGATVTGTPTVVGNTTSTFTATAATTGKTATATINWTVSVVADLYFPYTTLLLSGGTATETFVADASTNNFALAIAGDTKPNNFNPYTPGYYSNYFDGNEDVIYVTESGSAFTFGTGDYEYSAWIFTTDSGSGQQTIFGRESTGNAQVPYIYIQPTTRQIGLYYSSVILSGTTAIAANRWYYITVSRVGGTSRIFVNGVLEASAADSANLTAAGKVAIGGQWTGNGVMFVGYISNVRVVKGSGVTSVTVPTTPLTAIANTVLLTCQSNRFLDNSTNAFTITVAGNTTVNPNNPFVPNTAYATYGSTYFDGTGDYLTAPTGSAFQFAGNFTIEAWVNSFSATGQANWSAIFDTRATNVSSATGIVVNLNPSGYLNFYINGNNYTSATLLGANNWTHVALVRNSSTITLYQNGVSVASVSYATSLTSGYCWIGSLGGPAESGYWQGYISNLRVVNGVAVYTAAFTPPSTPLTAITGTSLLTLQTNQPANNSVFLDSSTNALAVTRVGNTSAGTFSPYGANWSNYFDGTGDYLTVPSNAALAPSTGDFTCEAWINISVLPSSGGVAAICQNDAPVTPLGNTRFWFGVYNNSGTSQLSLARHDTANRAFVNWTPTVGVWYHVAAVRQSGTVKLFIDGVLQTVTGSTDLSGVSFSQGGFAVGVISTPVYMNGYISNFRYVVGTAVYTSSFTPSTTPLTAISGTQLLTCQSNRFVDNSANAFTITKTGDVSVQRFSPFSPLTQTAISYSAYFDGTGDYLTVPSNAAFAMGTGDFTIECWINTSLVDAQDDVIIELRSSGATSTGFVFNLNPTGIGYQLNFYTDGAFNLGSTVLNYNVWNHCAVTRSGTTVRLFSNGALSATFTKANNFSDTPVVYIGNSPLYSPSDTIGYISNFRVVKGTAVYTAAFTPSSAPLTAIAGTSLLTCRGSTFVDNSTNAFAITAYGNSQPRIQNPFGFTNTAAAYSAATYGGSAYFDGTGDYLSVPTATPIVLSGTVWTIECWCYLTSSNFSTYRILINKRSGSSVASYDLFFNITTGYLAFYNGTQYTSSAVPIINAWNHIAAVYDGTNINLYMNGVRVLQSATTNPDNGGNLYISADENGSSNYFIGYVSNVRIVKGTAVYTSNFVPPVAPVTVITNTSLLLNMTSAGVYDSTMINDLETVGDAKILSTQTPYAGSYYSNYFGSANYIFAASNAAFGFGTEDFTVEAWVYPNAAYTTYNYIWATGITNGLVFYVLGGVLYVRTYNGSDLLASSTAPTLNIWTHVAVTRSGTTLRIFVNGVQTGTTTNSTNFATGSGIVGNDGANAAPWLGYISNMRVVKGTAVYTTTFTPSTTPLTAIANTSILTCQSNRFVDNSTNAFALTVSGSPSVQSFNPFQRNSGSSMLFSGSSGSNPTTRVRGYGPVYNLNAANFTVEMWYYPTAHNSTGYPLLYSSYESWVSGSVYNGLIGLLAGNQNYAVGSKNKVYLTLGDNYWYGTTTVPPLNTWTHIALVRDVNRFMIFINGTMEVDTTQAAGTMTNNQLAVVGGGTDAAGLNCITGYINDFRLTKGVARYTSTFTPPTTAFITK